MTKQSIKRVSNCICFYCICRAARVGLRRILYPFRRVTARASRDSAHDGEGERKRGLGLGFHRVNYTIFAALCVGFRGGFSWPRKVSVVRREQIRVLFKTAPLPGHPRCERPLVGGYARGAPLPGHPLRGLAPLGGYAQSAAGKHSPWQRVRRAERPSQKPQKLPRVTTP